MLKPQSPFAEWFGIQVVSVDDQRSYSKMHVMPHHLNKFGSGHGGVCLSLADHACGALLAHIAQDSFYATITLNSAFYLPVSEGELSAIATLNARTKTTAHIEVAISQQDKMLFKARGSFAIRQKRQQ